MQHYYENVRGLGHVALSRHAQQRAGEEALTDEMIAEILAHGTDRPDGLHTIWREHKGVRLVVIVPTPFTGARLVTTLYRIEQQEKAR